MKVCISADWEGVAGIVNWKQEDEDTMRARRLMTGEVNAAVSGAIAAGATEVIVNDAHNTCRNIIPEELHPQAKLVSGGPKGLSMVEGVTSDTYAALFIGYHARSGTPQAVMDHTHSSKVVQEIRLNGQPVGETTVNAALCGCFGVPVVLVSGDQAVAEEAASIGAHHVCVKESLSRFSACSVHPEVARQRIQQGVVDALASRESFRPYSVERPVTFELDVPHCVMVESMCLVPGVRRIAPRTISFTHQEFLTAFNVLRVVIMLAGA